ncbi:MAG: MoxR family ATPase [Bacillota bacterium]
METGKAREKISAVLDSVQQAIVGKRCVIEYVLLALICQGHVLVEDVPGVGKTTLVRALARALGCNFRRIQFTPDLLPSDITGVTVFNEATATFEYRPGPIMGQIILADEINRASPKTQSSLLECMEEQQVTVDGVSYPLPRPFLVLATQNPIEYEGTFPLPEAQLDRFLIRVSLGYPHAAEEAEILLRLEREHPLAKVEPVVTAADVIALQDAVSSIYVHPDLRHYIVRIVERTRQHADVYLGASPRGSIATFRCARALALMRGRDYVVPDDIIEVASITLPHRILLKPEARLYGQTPEQVVRHILGQAPVPTERSSHGRR